MKKIEVLDITLRAFNEAQKDLSFREKIAVVKKLELTGVNAIELPSISNNKEDAIVYKTIAEEVSNATICMPVCDLEGCMERAIDCLKNAKSKRLQVILPVSTVQMEYVYHLKAPKMLEKIVALVEKGVNKGFDVEFVALDATRADEDFVISCAKSVYEKGAKIITLSDDAGIFFPNEFANLVKKVKDSCDIKVYVQPSDKLKMSAAIAVECIKSGADGIKTAVDCKDYLSVDILGEILRAKGYDLGVSCDLDITAIHKIVDGITDLSNLSNTAATKGDSLNGDKFTVDNTLEDIGKEIKTLGYDLSVEDLGKVYEEFKHVVEKKGAIGERELEAIVASSAMQVPSTYHLVSFVVNSGNIISATANVQLSKDGVMMTGVAMGDGPIDAAFQAIEQIVGHHYELDDFSVSAVTKGREAVGSAIIRLRDAGKLFSGNGVSTDIVGACIRAYVNALNKIIYTEN